MILLKFLKYETSTLVVSFQKCDMMSPLGSLQLGERSEEVEGRGRHSSGGQIQLILGPMFSGKLDVI